MDPTQPWMLALLAAVSFLLSFVGASVGLILGHLRLPLLVAYLGGPTAGAACNLLTSGVGALAGALRHLRDGRVSWSVLGVMGVPSLVGAVVASYVFAKHVSHFWSHVAIGVMLVVSAVNLIRAGLKDDESPPGSPNLVLEVLIGLGLGALAAVTGLMLGSLRLPMMIRWLKIDPRVAVGSNMAIGSLTGLVAAATTLLSGGADLPKLWATLAVLALPTVLGGYLGGAVTGRLKKENVQRLAGWIIGLTGLFMIVQVGVPEYRRAMSDGALTAEDVPEFLGDEGAEFDSDGD